MLFLRDTLISIVYQIQLYFVVQAKRRTESKFNLKKKFSYDHLLRFTKYMICLNKHVIKSNYYCLDKTQL